MKDMYKATTNSPSTYLSGAINATDVTIYVNDATVLPPAPNILTIFDQTYTETIKYTGISGNTITGCIRGIDGIARDWAVGKEVARVFTAIEINNIIDNINEVYTPGVPIIPSVAYGMNSKISNTGKESVSPKFTFTGQSVINLLGKAGNCEDLTKIATFSGGGTPSLDTTNKVFGNNGLKLTQTGAWGEVGFDVSTLDKTQYYCISAYLKNNNFTSGLNISLSNSSGTAIKTGTTTVTDATKFNRVFLKVSPTDMTTASYASITSGGAASQYGYCDGVMVEKITSTQYSDSNFVPSPYVDGYACLQNLYIEVRHDNLVRNGNGEEGIAWWIANYSGTTLSLENGKFKFVSSTDSKGCNLPKLYVKSNTDYYISANVSGNSTIRIYASDGSTLIREGSGTFNSGTSSFLYVFIWNALTGTGYADSIMLKEGITAPSQYLSCRVERTVLETMLADPLEQLIYQNGEANGLLWWKHRTLFGRDYDWQFILDYTGYKAITMPVIIGLDPNVNAVSVKYDGSILPNAVGVSTGTNIYCDNTTNMYLTMSDADTGWAEAINPNNDEAKCFMNGWKAIVNNGTRYLCWLNITDGSIVPIATNTLVTVATSGVTQTVTSGTGTNFVNGDILGIVRNGVGIGTVTVSSSTANTITFTVSYTSLIGDILVKCDNGSTNLSLLNYCKANVAPNYQGYQLHYKLQNPEPITDANCHVHGDIPLLDVGDNYVYLDAGMVLGEIANFIYSSSDTNYYLNNTYQGFTPSMCKNKVETFNSLYKNQINQPMLKVTTGAYLNGNEELEILNANYDPYAIYTVDYKILATIAPQVGTLALQYNQDLFLAINSIDEELNNKQNHDSALDNLIDSSLYESGVLPNVYTRASIATGSSVIFSLVKFLARKKTIPLITLSSITVLVRDGSGNAITVIPDNIRVLYVTTDSFVVTINMNTGTNATYALNNGAMVTANFIADCRGRI